MQAAVSAAQQAFQQTFGTRMLPDAGSGDPDVSFQLGHWDANGVFVPNPNQ